MKKEITAMQVGGFVYDPEMVLHQIKPACESKQGGQWYCATHREFFENQFAKDCHIHTGKHSLVWFCHEHGFEQP